MASSISDAKQFPSIAFTSTAIKMTGPNTAEVTGDLSLHGITRPVTLSMTYNGGYKGHVYEPRARIGFSATGSSSDLISAWVMACLARCDAMGTGG